jgi:predicted component of type VI protein secretion system
MSDAQRTTPYLVLRSGDDPERAVIWDTLDITVGRLDSQDIEVPDPEVSRQHAVLRRDGAQFTVEDLGTGLGTRVNGERIERHVLEHGDVIEIGTLTLRFGRTDKPIRPGPNVHFASVLKGGSLPALAGDASGRTMLGFDVAEDLLPAVPAAAGPDRRAVSADGSLEALDDEDPLGLSIDAMDLQQMAAPRDLDLELAALPKSAPSTAPTRVPLARSAAQELASSATQLSLVVEGPAQEIEALLAALGDKRIQIGSLSLRIRKPR